MRRRERGRISGFLTLKSLEKHAGKEGDKFFLAYVPPVVKCNIISKYDLTI